MSRWTDFIAVYREARVGEQKRFYENRSDEFERAGSQAAIVTIGLLMLTGAVSALQGVTWDKEWEWARPWVAFAGLVLPALSTALAAYCALYAFDRHVKLYRDAQTALRRSDRHEPAVAPGSAPDELDASIAGYVQEVEQIFQLEQGQWGQVVNEIKQPEIPKANEADTKHKGASGQPPER